MKKKWNHKTDELRTRASQKFEAQHPRRLSSLRKRPEIVLEEGTNSRLARRETVSEVAAKDPFGIGDDDGNVEEPNDRVQAIDAIKAMDTWSGSKLEWNDKAPRSTQSPLTSPYANVEKPNDRVHRIEAIKPIDIWAGSKLKWEGKASEASQSPPTSPYTVRSFAEKQRLVRDRIRHNSLVKSRIPRPNSIVDRRLTDHGISPVVKNDPDYDSKTRPSGSKQVESSHNEGFQNARLENDSNEKDSRQDRTEHMKSYADKDYPPKSQPKGRDSNYDPQLHPPGSGDALFDDDRITRRDFGSWYPSNEQRSDHVLPSKSAEPDHDIHETSDCEKEAVSDKGEKKDETGSSSEIDPSFHSNVFQSQPSGSECTLVDASSIHNLVEEQIHVETNETKEAPDPPHSLRNIENISHDPQPKSPGDDQTENSNSQSNTLGNNQNRSPNRNESPHIARSPDTMESQKPKTQPKSPSDGDMKSHDPQSKSSESDHAKSSDPQPKSPKSDQNRIPGLKPRFPESGGVSVEKTVARDNVVEDDDQEACLNSDARVPGNYKAFFHGSQSPGLLSPDRSSSPGSGKDSLIVSPTRTDEYERSDEDDWNSTSIANAEIIKMFDKYKANSQLQPNSEEEEAKYWRRAKAAEERDRARGMKTERSSVTTPSSDGSLLLSPVGKSQLQEVMQVSDVETQGQYNEESRTMSEIVLDDLEDVEEEEEEEGANQAVMDLIELHRANHELQKDMEAKEAKFKREIQIAWRRPRPPPTTEEQRRDRAALEAINSKEIFDEFGDQIRPIRTDPQLVVRETAINIMITRARTCHLLEDYRRMYTRANQAVEAASPLGFPPLTARCCFYRGLASYLHRDFSSARDDFLEARGCAGLYGISSDCIERYIQLIDSATDPPTAILEPFLARRVTRGRQAGRTRRAPRTHTHDENQPSPSTADDATTLVGGSAGGSPVRTASDEEERSTGQERENVDPETQVLRLRRPSQIGGLPPDDDSQPATDDVPDYQPREEAIAEEIRKDIFESKARSLSEAGPAEASPQGERALAPATMANTECTLLGSNKSPGTTRHAVRPYVDPITTSLATASNTARETSPQADPESGDMDDRGSDEMGSDEIYAAFGGRPGEGGTSSSAQSSDV